MRFIDLFAGVGGIRLGVERACDANGVAHECVLSSEINEQACQTYELNFGEHPAGDVHDIVDVAPFDMLLGGFPCQPFSYAGKRMGFGDTRGTLFFEIERLLSAYHPQAFLLENVRGLYTHDSGRTFKTIMQHLHDLGYQTYDLLLNSSNFGVPQNRVRLYIVGILGAQPQMNLTTDLGAADSHRFKAELGGWLNFEGRREIHTVGEIIEPQVPEQYYCSEHFNQMLHRAVGEDLSVLHGYRLIDYRGGKSLHSWEMGMKGDCSDSEIRFMNLLIQNRRKPIFGREQDGKKLTLEQIQTFYKDSDIHEVIKSLLDKRYLKEQDGLFSPVCGNMSFEVFKFLDPESIAITLTSSDTNRLGVIQNNRARRITPRECARLQGFPDNFQPHPIDSYAYKQFGNSVSVPVIQAIMNDFIQNNLEELHW